MTITSIASRWKDLKHQVQQGDQTNVVAFPSSHRTDARRLRSYVMADIAPESVEWLWEPYVPMGETTLVQGDPGVGKSTLTLDLALRVAKGTPFPEQSRLKRNAGRVLVLSAEDSMAKTIRPRLDKLGADEDALRRIEVVPEPVALSRAGLDLLTETLRDIEPDLVIIDPVVAYLGSDIDMHRANEVRAMMAPLGALAKGHDCAIVLVHHLRKAQAGKAIHQAVGSIDFIAAVRSVVTVYRDDGRSVMAHAKANLSGLGPSLEIGRAHV